MFPDELTEVPPGLTGVALIEATEKVMLEGPTLRARDATPEEDRKYFIQETERKMLEPDLDTELRKAATGLREAMDRPTRAPRMFMHQQDWDDIVKWQNEEKK